MKSFNFLKSVRLLLLAVFCAVSSVCAETEIWILDADPNFYKFDPVEDKLNIHPADPSIQLDQYFSPGLDSNGDLRIAYRSTQVTEVGIVDLELQEKLIQFLLQGSGDLVYLNGTIYAIGANPNGIKKRTPTGSISNLYTKDNIRDITWCGGNDLCFSVGAQLYKIDVVTQQVTVHPIGYQAPIYIAYSPQSDHLYFSTSATNSVHRVAMDNFDGYSGSEGVLAIPSGIAENSKIAIDPTTTGNLVRLAVIDTNQTKLKIFEFTSDLAGTTNGPVHQVTHESPINDVHFIANPMGSGGGSQAPECNNGLDDDSDGDTDFPDDQDCISSSDDSESTGCPDGTDGDTNDSDGDGTLNCIDACDNDSGKTEPGVCGCGTKDSESNIADTDRDGVPNCLEQCDSNKFLLFPDTQCPEGPDCVAIYNVSTNSCSAATCGEESSQAFPPAPDCTCDQSLGADGSCADPESCGSSQDCQDLCPTDSLKIDPGVCGCGVPDNDSDRDDTENCIDGCAANPHKTEPTILCGCSNENQQDDGSILCGPKADLVEGLPMGGPSVSLKLRANGSGTLTVFFEELNVGLPSVTAAKSRKKSKKTKSKPVQDNYVFINRLNIKTQKTKKITEVTRKNKFKTSVKKGDIITVRVQAREGKSKSKPGKGSPNAPKTAISPAVSLVAR